jgi:hypothetical protein
MNFLEAMEHVKKGAIVKDKDNNSYQMDKEGFLIMSYPDEDFEDGHTPSIWEDQIEGDWAIIKPASLVTIFASESSTDLIKLLEKRLSKLEEVVKFLDSLNNNY